MSVCRSSGIMCEMHLFLRDCFESSFLFYFVGFSSCLNSLSLPLLPLHVFTLMWFTCVSLPAVLEFDTCVFNYLHTPCVFKSLCSPVDLSSNAAFVYSWVPRPQSLKVAFKDKLTSQQRLFQFEGCKCSLQSSFPSVGSIDSIYRLIHW